MLIPDKIKGEVDVNVKFDRESLIMLAVIVVIAVLILLFAYKIFK